MCVDRHDPDSGAIVDPTGSVDAYRFLSEPRRVAILTELATADGELAIDVLARRIAATERGKSPDEISDREQRLVRVSLRHNHLPKLAAHSVVECHPDGTDVSLTPEVSISRIRQFVDRFRSVPSARALRTLSQPRRRLVVQLLSEHGTPMSVDELARLIASAETAANPGSLSAHAYDRVRISLLHSHLPALSSANIVAYEQESGTVDEPTWESDPPD